jgi:hypothetical protein
MSVLTLHQISTRITSMTDSFDTTLMDMLWVLWAAALVFVMQAGFLCLEAGTTRTKNAINVAMKNLADFAIAVSVFWLVGFGVMFGTLAVLINSRCNYWAWWCVAYGVLGLLGCYFVSRGAFYPFASPKMRKKWGLT